MNPIFVLFFFIALSQAAPTSPTNLQTRQILDSVGKGIAAIGNVVAPKESERAACAKYGFIDPEYRTSSYNQGGLFEAGSALFGTTAMDVFNLGLPPSALRAGCIETGLYHPERYNNPR